MAKRNGTNTVICVENKSPALCWPGFLVLMLCLRTIVGRRLIVGWSFQCVGLSELNSVLLMFLWP